MATVTGKAKNDHAQVVEELRNDMMWLLGDIVIIKLKLVTNIRAGDANSMGTSRKYPFAGFVARLVGLDVHAVDGMGH